MASTHSPVPSLAWFCRVKEIIADISSKFVEKVKDSHNVASILPSHSCWYSLATSVPAGKAIPVNDFFARLLPSQLSFSVRFHYCWRMWAGGNLYCLT